MSLRDAHLVSSNSEPVPSGAVSLEQPLQAKLRLRFLAFGLLLGLGILNSSLIPLLSLVGLGAMMATTAIAATSCLRTPFPGRLVATFMPLLVVYSLSIASMPAAAAVKPYVQLVAGMLAFILGWRFSGEPDMADALRATQLLLLGFAAVGVACVLLFSDAETNVFTNPNTAGAAAFTGIMVAAAEGALRPVRSPRGGRTLRVLAFLALLLLSAARAALLGLLAASFVLAGWRVITRTRTRFWAVFVGAAIVIVAGTWLLAQIAPELEIYESLQNESKQYTGKNVGTRAAVWSVALPDIEARPLLGWGLGRRAGDNPEGNPDLSCHNQYIELGIKTGYTGIACLVAMFASIWGLLWRGRERQEARVAAALLLGLAFHQMFEVNLLQVGFSQGLIWWLLLGIGASAGLGRGRWSRAASGVREPAEHGPASAPGVLKGYG